MTIKNQTKIIVLVETLPNNRSIKLHYSLVFSNIMPSDHPEDEGVVVNNESQSTQKNDSSSSSKKHHHHHHNHHHHKDDTHGENSQETQKKHKKKKDKKKKKKSKTKMTADDTSSHNNNNNDNNHDMSESTTTNHDDNDVDNKVQENQDTSTLLTTQGAQTTKTTDKDKDNDSMSRPQEPMTMTMTSTPVLQEPVSQQPAVGGLGSMTIRNPPPPPTTSDRSLHVNWASRVLRSMRATPAPSDELLDSSRNSQQPHELIHKNRGDSLSFDDNDKSSPFAIRVGKNLRFDNVNMTLLSKHSQRNHFLHKKDDDHGVAIATGDNDDTNENNEANNIPSNLTSDQDVNLLANVWGTAPAGEVTAIMGTSGSGKTSLLNVLSGRITDATQKNISVSGNVHLNGFVVDPSNVDIRKTIAFVAQDDSLQVTATPREAILFSARLRLPKTTPLHDLLELTEVMLKELRLTKCADTMIGGHLLKGVSGGERKRTSVGVELVTRPSLIFLDEPTSGLDSFNALALCQVLKKVAMAGSAVLMTIHQPSSEIFNALDRLILLEKGEVMYGGLVQDVPQYFELRGYPCPAHYNPADWIVNIAQTVNIEDLKAAGFFPQLEDEDREAGITADSRHSDRLTILEEDSHQKVSFPIQTRLQFLRELRNFGRNRSVMGARAGMTLLISIIGGIIFFQIGQTDRTQFINVQSTFGALLMSGLANVFATALPSLVAFPEERPVFMREYSTNHYSVVSYFSSRLTMELVITALQVLVSSLLTYFLMGLTATFGLFWAVCYVLAMTSTALGVLIGCAVKDPGVAVELLPMVFMPQILFSGFFIPPELIPVWLRWLNYVFPLAYAIKLLVVAEFEACSLDPTIPVNMNNCARVMENVQAYPEDTWWYWIVLLVQFAFARLLGLFLLRSKATKFY